MREYAHGLTDDGDGWGDPPQGWEGDGISTAQWATSEAASTYLNYEDYRVVRGSRVTQR